MVRWPSSETPLEPSFDCSSERTWLSTDHDRGLTTAKEMWDVVKAEAMTKSTLNILNAEEQLANMKLYDDEDSQTHLSEIKNHFEIMLRRCNNLISIGSTISDS